MSAQRRAAVALGVAGLAAMLAAAPAVAQITVFEHDGFQGRHFTTDRAEADLSQRGLNDRASSAVVVGQAWEICEHGAYGGRCRVLRPGQYASLTAMGMNDRVSSVRAVPRHMRLQAERYAPEPVVAADYRRRAAERLFEARVTASRAVYGTPEQRCWMESENATGAIDRRVPAALLGAVIGGILGHQVGGGSGRDLATVGGTVAGAAVGGQVAGPRDGRAREVQRCETNSNAAVLLFWDVTYVHRGQEHHVQLAQPPGRTVTVNRRGEPRA